MQIVFVFPYRHGGGVPQLFARCAIELSSKINNKVSILDYYDGSLSKLVKDSNVEHIVYNDEKLALVPDGSIVVFQLMTPWSIFKNIEYGDNCRLLFWACHPFNVVPTLPLIRKLMSTNAVLSKILYATLLKSFYLATRNFLDLLIENNAIIFMDRENHENITNYLNFKFSNPSIVPLGVSHEKIEIEKAQNFSGYSFNFLWIGRIVDFKYFALKKFIDDLTVYCVENKQTVSFTVIGDGEYRSKLESIAKENKLIKFEFINQINIDDLSFYLKNVHCAVAMGTAAIDCAVRKVPTILLDFHYKEFPHNYKYSFIFEQEGATLGRSLSQKRTDGRYLSCLLSELQNNNEKLSYKSFKYVREVHSLQLTVEKLENAFERTKLAASRLEYIGYNNSRVYNFFLSC